MDSFEKRNPCQVLIASLKSPKELCCVEATVNTLEKRDSSTKSLFHWQILKCRQLIFSDSHIMASPVLGAENLIYIIMDQAYLKNGKIIELFSKLNLSVKEPKPVTNRMYESCLHYSIKARIAPQWNEVGSYLIQSRNFLSTNQPLPAVKLDICITEDIFIILWPLRIRLQQINLDDLSISTNISQDFLVQNTTTISDVNLGLQWVHVLPSLKKGQIVSITHQIPNTCPFKSYRELKRHWKNMYGYRLPEEENNVFYYNIAFNAMNSTLYTYPSACIKSNSYTMLPNTCETDILKHFHDDLLKKFPSLCGDPLLINKNLVYAVPKLNKSSMDACSSFFPYPNLKLSDLIEIKPIITSSPMLFKEAENLTASQDDLFSNKVSQALSICGSFMTSGTGLPLQPTTEVTVIPHSRPKSPKNTYIESSLPAFPLQRNQNWGRNELEKNNIGIKQYFPTESIHRDLQFIQRVVQVDQNLVVTTSKAQFGQGSGISSKQSGPSVNKSLEDIEVACTSSEHISTAKSENSDIKASNYTSTQNIVMEKTRVYYQPSTAIQKSHCPGTNLTETIHINETSLNGDKENGLKRETFYLGHHELGPIAKKPRARPQVQPDIDVELLARNNDLGRVNTATLVYWLRNKLVPCKVKDKKSELVNKVKQYLNLPLESGP